MKKGFGLMEVLVAAVVLGFMILGLNTLQKGNREALLRVRARDAASFVAQHVLDSLGSVGINSIVAEQKDKCNNQKLVYCAPEYKYNFEGNKGDIKTDIKYRVEVALLDSSKQTYETKFETKTTTYAKNLEATVSWDHKKSTQSIKIAKVVR